MGRRSPVRNGANLSAVGAGNIDVLGAGCAGGGWMRGSIVRKRAVGHSNGCVENRGDETGEGRE